MFSLPIEAKLDVLKCLNFNQLSSIKLTNFYFFNLIKKYEEQLCFRMKFNKLLIDGDLRKLESYRIIKPKPVLEYTLDKRLKKEWQKILNSDISLFYDPKDPLYVDDCFFYFERTFDNLLSNEPRYYILKLPQFPEDIEEMVIIRYCLEQIFNCVFESALFSEIVFNSQVFYLLFNYNTPQLHIQKLTLFPNNESLEELCKFVYYFLTISECLCINLNHVMMQSGSMIRFLLFILKNRGNKLPKILLKKC
uniref:Uncharacterized protein n=1 Tax=Meloidogyne enterolobii TaxID=390850 RepID=A0A6V7X511_MELEN|nr:unnamed protein product [Meloidogyne enterolobii]